MSDVTDIFKPLRNFYFGLDWSESRNLSGRCIEMCKSQMLNHFTDVNSSKEDLFKYKCGLIFFPITLYLHIMIFVIKCSNGIMYSDHAIKEKKSKTYLMKLMARGNSLSFVATVTNTYFGALILIILQKWKLCEKIISLSAFKFRIAKAVRVIVTGTKNISIFVILSL